MTDDRVKARCTDCSKTYRLPPRRSSARCPACGAEVRPLEVPASSAGIGCPACSAINKPQSRYCEECGETLESRSRSGRARGSNASAAAACLSTRRSGPAPAAAELQRAHRSIKMLRWVYLLNAILSALYLASLVDLLRNPEVAASSIALFIGLQTLFFVAFVVGAIQVPFYPFAWALTVALLATLSRVLQLTTGKLPELPVVITAIQLAWTVFLWALVLPTLKTRTLIAENRELYIAQRLRGSHRSRRGNSSVEHGEELEHRGKLRMWKLSVAAALGILAASMLGSYSVYAKIRPPVLTVVLDDFRAAWNASRRDKVVEFFDEDSGETNEMLGRMAAARGWGPALPVLGPVVREKESRSRAEVHYPTGQQDIAVLWKLRHNDWVVDQIAPPAPPADEFADRFAAAWNASDITAIGELNEPDDRASFLDQLERMRELRSWTDALPALEQPRVEVTGRHSAKAEFQTSEGFLTARFRLRNDRWFLLGLAPPRR